MTFRPSDSVLEDVSTNSQISSTSELKNNNELTGISLPEEDGAIEEVKAPDLLELLKNHEENDKNQIIDNNDVQDKEIDQDFSIDLSGIQSINSEDPNLMEDDSQNLDKNVQYEVDENREQNLDNSQNTTQLLDDGELLESKLGDEDREQKSDNLQNTTQLLDDGESIEGKLGDEDRINLVSEVEGSVHSNLDFLVDEQWLKIVKNYRNVHRIVFRRGVFIVFTILGIFAGIFVQVHANQSGNLDIVNDSSVYNTNYYSDEFEIINLPKWKDMGIEVVIPYGLSKMNGDELLTKSNLVSYKGIILPQMAFINKSMDNMISLEDFENKELSRADLENTINFLVSNDSLSKKINDLPKVSDFKGEGQRLKGGLIDGFSLGCLFETKASDKICDKILDIFYKYGKYYNLFEYRLELLKLIDVLKDQDKNISSICDMIKEYALHLGVSPYDDFISVMKYCTDEDKQYFKKLVDFINIENSLGQPEISNQVFDDPDLNAYKLLSVQQSVHKILEGATINKNFIVSYLKFVQNLINKDKGTHKYLDAIYMDLLYVFNMDELYVKLQKRGELTSDLKEQIDQINNGNSLLKNESLLVHLTTPNIVAGKGEFTGGVVGSDRTIEDIFSQYYSMTDRLKIRQVTKIFDDELRVKTEIFSNDIYSAVGETLKSTVYLYRKDNTLYVKEINIAGQQSFSDILNEYVSEGLVTFYEMIGYIDEKVGLWYKVPTNESDIHNTFCEQLGSDESIALYDCDDSNILLYNGSIEYNFSLDNGVLVSFTVSDEELDNAIKERFGKLLFNKDNTPIIIRSIIEFKLERLEEENIEKKLQLIDQFRIHFKLIPDVYSIEGEENIFLVKFTLGDKITLQANYDIDTHLLTKIFYVACGKMLEIRNLTIEVSANNEQELAEILNNPRIFLTRVNQSAFKKYQRMCE